MANLYTIFISPIILSLLFSCSMDAMQEKLGAEGEHGYNFKESRTLWKDLKKKNGNDYMYTVLEQSWTGTGSETTIEVEKGKVVGRYYVAFIISEEDGSREVTGGYEETSKKDIGRNALGAPPYTIDDLYRVCISKVLTVNKEINEVLFETNEEGMMVLCGFVPVGCVDDCYSGIRISGFEWK